ncbi:sensor histidine kinase [Mobiluncus mulieris]|nr:histidine kinase [Mobiluncus mulieris]
MVVYELIPRVFLSSLNEPEVWLIVVFGIELALAAWLGVVGDLIYIAVFFTYGFTQHSDLLSMPSFGINLIVVVWLIQHWNLRALTLLAAMVAFNVWQDKDPGRRIIGELFIVALVLAIGYSLRFITDRARKTERQLMKSRQSAAAIREELATQLHDTIAKDLAQVAISVENLATTHPELAAETAPIVTLAREAAGRIRPLIMNLNAKATPPSLNQAIRDSRTMLHTRGLTLKIDPEAELDKQLTRQTIQTAALFVRECATNALKYSENDTDVDLLIDLDGDTISLMMANTISSTPVSPQYTSGYGLVNLQSRIEGEGGKMLFTRRNNRWIINAIIPRRFS